MFALAQMRWSVQNIYIYVAAFGVMGHHLLGMTRASGDRALFARYRGVLFLLRFFYSLSAPLSLGGLGRNYTGHFLLVRLARDDADLRLLPNLRCEDGVLAALTRRLDLATCAIWFAAAVLLSSSRMRRCAGGVLRQRRT
ncbi:MAG: hypothetical protein M3480_07215 [Verrucomicrobiota bacterium]|nr:hypothetical protein [Verrucomicrobiota bacterium]